MFKKKNSRYPQSLILAFAPKKLKRGFANSYED